MDQRWGLTAGGGPTRGLLYRDAVKAAAAIEWANSGQTTCHYQPGHPHGFHEHIYLGSTSGRSTTATRFTTRRVSAGTQICGLDLPTEA
jgi:hypothetical protein